MRKRIIIKIRYGYLWRARARFRQWRLHVMRRILWRVCHQRAEYKAYGANKGSEWAGRYTWRNRVIAYVDEHGNVWC
jgi:hypothetical protein